MVHRGEVLSFPIWDAGITRDKVDQAKANASKANNTLDQLKLSVALEVRSAALTVQEALDRVSTTAENVSLAEESLRLANVRYNAGISVLVEVLDAENALTRAKFNHVNAIYDARDQCRRPAESYIHPTGDNQAPTSAVQADGDFNN